MNNASTDFLGRIKDRIADRIEALQFIRNLIEEIAGQEEVAVVVVPDMPAPPAPPVREVPPRLYVCRICVQVMDLDTALEGVCQDPHAMAENPPARRIMCPLPPDIF